MHGSFGIQNISCLMHEFGTFNISFSTDDFGFWQSLSFGSHWKISLELFGKSHIFDKDLLNEDSPFVDFLVYKLFNCVRNCLSFLKKILKGILTTNCSQSGICYFCNWLHDTLNCVISHFRVDNSVVNTGINVDCNVVFCKD